LRLDLFVKLKYKLSTITLFVYIIYSMRDLLSDLSDLNNPMPDPEISNMRQMR